MIMSDDKKKSTTLIIKKMKNGMEQMHDAPKEENGDEMDMEQAGYMSAAEEMMSAIEAKDSRALMEAIKSFVDMCMDKAE